MSTSERSILSYPRTVDHLMLAIQDSPPDVPLTPEITSRRSNSCITCCHCSSCSIESLDSRLFIQGSTATSFEYLLCAGSLTLRFLSSHILCTHQHAGDGFHAIQDVYFLRPYLGIQGIELLDALSFLLRNRFILVTYALTPSVSGVILRVYLIPHDLPSSRGALRSRNEDRVMRPARTYLRKVLSVLTKKRSVWDAADECFDQPSPEDRFLGPNEDQRSLSQIFNDLTATDDVADLTTIPHLRATLYRYQKESVARMLAMEAPNRIADDPLYASIIDLDGKVFYFQPATMELFLQRPRSFQARGGILCEELGTGKTVMTLALILSTLDVLSEPPEHDSCEVVTPLAFRHFPQNPYHVLRAKNASKRWKTLDADKHKGPVPTLTEILCHYARRNPSAVNLRAIEDIQLWHYIKKNAPFYFESDLDYARGSSVRQKKSRRRRILYLTTATLVVVPSTLQAQWYSEILKHCSSSVQVLVIKSRRDIPAPLTLASEYDIILTTYNVISAEAAITKDIFALNTGYTCSCPEFDQIRIPDCKCQCPENVSPLLQVRWKRVIRDEGHNAASPSTSMNYFLQLMSVERRWIVTGTPTTNLLGLSFGSSAAADSLVQEVRSPEASPPLPLIYSLYEETPEEHLSEKAEVDSEDEPRELQYAPHVWSKADREDLRKLGIMLSDFLSVLPFAVEPESFSTLVVNGLMQEAGPLPGALRVLEQVMTANMVRHRVSDVERFVRLPQMKEEVVLLDLEEYGQMTYNVLLSYVVVNAVDSERKDMDYLFHPSKAVALASTIENLSQSLFWRFDENAFDLELSENIHRAGNAIEHARERGQPDEDIQLVQKAMFHLQKALDNRQFRDMQHGLEAPYCIRNAPPRVRQTWTLVHEPDYALDEFLPFLIYPSFALELRSAVLHQPLINEHSLAERAELLRAKNEALSAYVAARRSKSERRLDSKSSPEKRRRGETQVDRMILDSARRTATVDSTEKLQELHEEFKNAQERLKAEAMKADNVEGSEPSLSPHGAPVSRRESMSNSSSARERMLRSSPWASVRVGNSTSSKLNYVLEEVRKYSATEKFVIFSSQPFNLVHISEGLDLMGIKYLHFMKEATRGKKKGPQRDQWLTTFETSEMYRVFLMELKHGARGLNIVSASRVIFCEPVWHADVESQAIKRVHRIGQTRPVTVKTLAIRSTFEEYMIERRRQFKGRSSKLPGLTEEWGVRNYLQNPAFLEMPPQITATLDFPLIQFPESNTTASESETVEASFSESGSLLIGDKTVDDIRSSTDQIETPSPKRRKVQFA